MVHIYFKEPQVGLLSYFNIATLFTWSFCTLILTVSVSVILRMRDFVTWYDHQSPTQFPPRFHMICTSFGCHTTLIYKAVATRATFFACIGDAIFGKIVASPAHAGGYTRNKFWRQNVATKTALDWVDN